MKLWDKIRDKFLLGEKGYYGYLEDVQKAKDNLWFLTLQSNEEIIVPVHLKLPENFIFEKRDQFIQIVNKPAFLLRNKYQQTLVIGNEKYEGIFDHTSEEFARKDYAHVFYGYEI